MRLQRGTRQVLSIAVGLAVALVLGAPAWAGNLKTVQIFFEFNFTDNDLGVQVFLDAGAWRALTITDPDSNTILQLEAQGSLGQLGLTEFFFESEEPSLEDVPLDELFARFPEGNYTFVGITVDGKTLNGKANFTHNIPAGPEIVFPAEGAVLFPNMPVVINWEPVTDPLPDTDSAVTIVGYQVIVERLKPQPLRVFSVDLPASATQVSVAPEFIQANAEYRFEVLAIEASGNQTISESTFKTTAH